MDSDKTFCRLCAQSGQRTIDIFGLEGTDNLVDFKIIETLSIVINKKDPLSHAICLLCTAKVDILWNFKNECHRAQVVLKKMHRAKTQRGEFANLFPDGMVADVCPAEGSVTDSEDGCENNCLNNIASQPGPFEVSDCSGPSSNVADFQRTEDAVKFHTGKVLRVDDHCSSISNQVQSPNHCLVSQKKPCNSKQNDDTVSSSDEDFRRNDSTESCGDNLPASQSSETNGEPKSHHELRVDRLERSTSINFESEESVLSTGNLETSNYCNTLTVGSKLEVPEAEHTSSSLQSLHNDISLCSRNEINSSSDGMKTADTLSEPSTLVSDNQLFENDDQDDDNAIEFSDEENNDNNEKTKNEMIGVTDHIIDDFSDEDDEEIGNKEGHFHVPPTDQLDQNVKVWTDSSDTGIPYLHITYRKTKLGRTLCIVAPDGNLDSYKQFDIMQGVGEYLRLGEMNLIGRDSEQRYWQVCVKNLIRGKCSLLPYFVRWPLTGEGKKWGFGWRCPFCLFMVTRTRQKVIHHLMDHLIYICPECGHENLNWCRFRQHMARHETAKFVCKECGETGFNGDLLKYRDHVRSHYSYLCRLCSFSTCDEKVWQVHMKRERASSDSHSVDCSLYYEDFADLRRHISKIKSIGGYMCGVCGMYYHTEDYLKWHYEVHGLKHGPYKINTLNHSELNSSSGGKSAKPVETSLALQSKSVGIKNGKRLDFGRVVGLFMQLLEKKIGYEEFACAREVLGGSTGRGFKCILCPKVTVFDERPIRRHIKNHLATACFRCKKFFKLKKELENHVNRYGCFTERSCIICENDEKTKFPTLELYLEHLQDHQKAVICIYCQHISSSSSKLPSHMKLKHSEKFYRCKGFICEICGASLKSLHGLQYHKDARHGEGGRKICALCGKAIMKYFFKAHSSVCHGNKVCREKFICHYCNKTFHVKSNLQRHIEVHLNEKKYKCEICQKRFNRESSLRKHKMDVHSLKKWKCQECDSSYSYQSALKTHLKRCH